MRRPWIVRAGGAILAAATGAGAVAGAIILTTGPAPAGTANEWVNVTAGASPARSSSPASYDSTKAYGTLAAACSASQAGDTIRVESGTYTGTQTLSGCGTGVTASCDGSVAVNPCLLTSPGTTLTVQTASSGITLDGFTITSTATLAPKALFISDTSGTPAANVTVKNTLVYVLTAGSTSCTGGTGCTTGAVFVQGTSNLTFGPGFQLLSCCSTDGFDVYRDGINNVGNSNLTFQSSTILGVYDACSHVHASMIPSQPSCTGYGIGNGCNSNNCEHDDGFAISDCQNCSILNSKLFEAGSQQIFLQEFNGGVISSTSIIGNFITGNGAPSSGGAGVNIGTFGTGAVTNYSGTFNFNYNTLIGVPFKAYMNDGLVDRWATGAVMNLFGDLSEGDNVAYGGSGSTQFPGWNTVVIHDLGGGSTVSNNNGCATLNGATPAEGSNHLTINYGYDWLYDVGPCTGTGNVNTRSVTKADVFTSITYPFDLHLTSGSDPAVNQGQATCASASPDLDGNTRPISTACDIGADEKG